MTRPQWRLLQVGQLGQWLADLAELLLHLHAQPCSSLIGETAALLPLLL